MQKAKQNEISKNIVICFSLSKPIIRYQFHLYAFFLSIFSFLKQGRERFLYFNENQDKHLMIYFQAAPLGKAVNTP